MNKTRITRHALSRLARIGAAALVTAALSSPAWAQNLKVALIEVLSGTMGNVGELTAKNLQFVVDDLNARGGAGGRPIEVVRFDSKGSPQEALAALKNAVDQGIQVVLQGNSSAVAGALVDAIDKHNQRNPGKRVLFLNFGALDPDLTNEKCNFWHFRFDAHADMKMAAITDAIRRDPAVKRVYLINQDYAFGHQVTKAAKAMLAAKRPDIQIVGEDLHPFGRVKDFSPYIAKMRAAQADTVISGNWGTDLTLLVRAAKDARYDVNWYTYYAGAYGSAAAIGEAGIGQVKVIVEWGPNWPHAGMDAFNAAYKKRHPAPADEFYYYRIKLMMEMLGQAVDRSRSTDPLKLAQALEGMTLAAETGDVTMRADDHQLLLPMIIPTFGREGSPGIRFGLEGSGYGFGNPVVVPARDITLPHSCKMVRPAG